MPDFEKEASREATRINYISNRTERDEAIYEALKAMYEKALDDASAEMREKFRGCHWLNDLLYTIAKLKEQK